MYARCELRDDDRVKMPFDDDLLDLDEALAKLASADPGRPNSSSCESLSA